LVGRKNKKKLDFFKKSSFFYFSLLSSSGTMFSIAAKVASFVAGIITANLSHTLAQK
jgi:hypothetical protein